MSSFEKANIEQVTRARNVASLLQGLLASDTSKVWGWRGAPLRTYSVGTVVIVSAGKVRVKVGQVNPQLRWVSPGSGQVSLVKSLPESAVEAAIAKTLDDQLPLCDLIACETPNGYAMHLREFEPEDHPAFSGLVGPATTLCGLPVGWDLRAPVASILGGNSCTKCAAGYSAYLEYENCA